MYLLQFVSYVDLRFGSAQLNIQYSCVKIRSKCSCHKLDVGIHLHLDMNSGIFDRVFSIAR